jgi:hypothetical protein
VRGLVQLALCAAGAIAATAALAALDGCGAGPTPQQQIDVGFWTANDAVCLRNATTKAQADSCADQQRILECGDGGILADSSACVDVRLSDGGKL